MYFYFCCLQNVVAIVMILVRWGIPDMSGDLHDKIRREAYITNEIIIEQEAKRARKSEYILHIMCTE